MGHPRSDRHPGLPLSGLLLASLTALAGAGCILERVPVAVVCGDGLLSPGEACDDGDANSATQPDACRPGCIAPMCGDGVVDSGETCDTDESPCRADCTSCGDGVVDASNGEECDDGPANSTDAGSRCLPDCTRVFRFVSIPDFPGVDLADLSALEVDVEGTNGDYEEVVDALLDDIAAQEPDFVVLGGDAVNGRWHEDDDGLEPFGPVSTFAERRAAVSAAADMYYGALLQRFADRGLEVHGVIGDHDLGGGPWPARTDDARLVPIRRSLWAGHFTQQADRSPRYELRPADTNEEMTAYAFQHRNAFFVSLDTHNFVGDAVELDEVTGTVAIDVSTEQLAWLDSLLANAESDETIEHIFVFGHAPGTGPLPVAVPPALVSGGPPSGLWTTLTDHQGVDLYLAGSAHTMATTGGEAVEQIVHGGAVGRASSINYLLVEVFPRRLEVSLRAASISYEGSGELWQVAGDRPPASPRLDSGFNVVGSFSMDKSTGVRVVQNRSGLLHPIGSEAVDTLAIHLPFDTGSSPTVVLNQGLTGVSNHAIIEGAGTRTAGVFDQALVLGPGERGNAGMPPFTTGARTLSVWFRTTQTASAATSGEVTLVGMGDNTPGRKIELDIYDIATTAGAGIGAGAGRLDALSTSNLNDGTWHHLIYVLDGPMLTDFVAYVDGVRVALDLTFGDNTTIRTDDSQPIWLGHSVNSEFFQAYEGALDDLAIWTRALGPAEVRFIYEAGVHPTISLDAGDVNELLLAFARRSDADVGGRHWRFIESGLDGPAGAIEDVGGVITIHLQDGAGLQSP